MLVGELDIPDRVLEAHERGDLVIFTGAGISIPAPSELPGFFELAKRIVTQTQFEVKPGVEAYRERIDDLLGLLDDDSEIELHELVRAEIDRPGSEPNSLHRSIVRIANAFTPRLVTTNFDRHLTTAATELGFPLEEFRAPALPVGDAFAGLVYLHGSLNQTASALVSTDADFGRAYLTDAWAARFLERMFRSFVVLFVGYSHTDPVMTYLGRALGPNNENRFVITDQPQAARWYRLGIQAIPYSGLNGHAALTRGLEAWADHVDMGLLDHKYRIRELVSTPAQLTPSQASYLSDSLRRPDRVKFFTEQAKDVFWLNWAAEQEPFQSLFERQGEPTEGSAWLANWFVESFALDENYSDAAFSIVADAGGRISRQLWEALGSSLHRSNRPRPQHHRRWLNLLMSNDDPSRPSDWLDYALNASEWPADRDEILALVEHLVQPVAQWRGGAYSLWGIVEVAPRGDEYWIREAWEKLLKPNLSDLAGDLYLLAAEGLRRHHSLLRAYGQTGRETWPSFHRPSIGESPEYSNALDVIVDIARDCLAELESKGSLSGGFLIDNLVQSSGALLRRLGVHALTQTSVYTPDEKLAKARQVGLASDPPVRHEWHQLVAATIPACSPSEIGRLVECARALNDGSLAGVYAAVRLLEVVLENGGVGDGSVQAELTRLTALLPQRSDQEEPVPGVEIPSPTELHEALRLRPAELGKDLGSIEAGSYRVGGEPAWSRLLDTVAEAVRLYPEDGFSLLDVAPQSASLRARVIASWAATQDSSLLRRILRRIRDVATVDDADAVDGFFESLLREAPDQGSWDEVPELRALASEFWEMLGDSPPEERSNIDWMTVALNHPAATVSRLALDQIRRQWARLGDKWDGMGSGDENFLDSLISGNTTKHRVALTMLGGNLGVLHAADRDWTRQHLLPKFDWSTSEMARFAWWGYLSQGRWDNRILADGILDGLIATALHLDRFDSQVQRRWALLLANIAIQADPVATTPDWMARLTRLAPRSHRVNWLNAVGACLDELTPEAVEFQWSRWILDYWSARLRNVPSPLSRAEASEMAYWVARLPLHLQPEACALAVSTAAGLDAHGDFVRHLTDEAIVQHPIEIGSLLAHLMRGTGRQGFYGGHRLAPKLRLLLEQPGDWTDLRQAALHIGIDLDST